MWIGILKQRNVFRWRVTKFCENFLRKRKLWFLLLCDAYNIIRTSMPMFAKYRVKVEQIILLVKIVHWYFERKECFLAVPVPKFWWWIFENQGRKKFVLVSCSFKAYCKLHRIAFTSLDAMKDISGWDENEKIRLPFGQAVTWGY